MVGTQFLRKPLFPHSKTSSKTGSAKATRQWMNFYPFVKPLNSDTAGTDWIRIIENGQKSVDGKTLGEVLVDILDKFPSYDLLSEEGVAEASHDIEARLSPVAKFKELESDV